MRFIIILKVISSSKYIEYCIPNENGYCTKIEKINKNRARIKLQFPTKDKLLGLLIDCNLNLFFRINHKNKLILGRRNCPNTNPTELKLSSLSFVVNNTTIFGVDLFANSFKIDYFNTYILDNGQSQISVITSWNRNFEYKEISLISYRLLKYSKGSYYFYDYFDYSFYPVVKRTMNTYLYKDKRDSLDL